MSDSRHRFPGEQPFLDVVKQAARQRVGVPTALDVTQHLNNGGNPVNKATVYRWYGTLAGLETDSDMLSLKVAELAGVYPAVVVDGEVVTTAPDGSFNVPNFGEENEIIANHLKGLSLVQLENIGHLVLSELVNRSQEADSL